MVFSTRFDGTVWSAEAGPRRHEDRAAWKAGALVYPAMGNADIGRNTNQEMYVNSISVHSLAFI
jgi:hypothetical protein